MRGTLLENSRKRVFLLLKMTIKQARQILGEQAKGVSDTELERDIEVAELLKNLFFGMVADSYKKPSKNSSKARPNVP